MTITDQAVVAPSTKTREPSMLIGFTDVRGEGWHYRQKDALKTYGGAIPVPEVKEQLFDWEPGEGTVLTEVVLPSGVALLRDKTRKTIIHPKSKAILGIFKLGYRPHPYAQWLVDNVDILLDGGLAIGQAGLLYGGARAYVQVELGENREVEGVEYRPYLTGATSLDGSLSSTFQVGATLITCDNAVSATLGDKEALRVKIRHSRRSLDRILEVRQALGLVETVGDEFATAVRKFVGVPVSDTQWAAFLDAHVPLTTKNGKPKESRARTLAEKKREELGAMWLHDNRVSPWRGTAFGVVQAVNTWTHHNSVVRGLSRAERNMERAVMGRVDDLDGATVRTLEKVLDRKLLSRKS